MAYGYNNAANAYKNNSVNYASKDQLLIMLVDGAVKFAKKAQIHLNEKNVIEAHENLMKTQNIFYELMVTLDKEASGEWGVEIYKVYQFIVERLSEANIKKSEEIMRETLPLIIEVRDMWNEVYEQSKILKKI